MKNYANGDYTIKCGCGCEVLKYHGRDETHTKEYYTRNYIPKRLFNKNFHKKDEFGKLGFTEIQKGKWVKNG